MAQCVDRIASQVQQDGEATVVGETLAELVVTCQDLGLDPARVRVHGRVAVITDAPAAPRA